MLVCSRIHEEYGASVRFQLHATMEWESAAQALTLQFRPQFNAMSAHVCHFTLIVDDVRTSPDIWNMAEKLYRALNRITHRLRSIQILARVDIHHQTETELRGFERNACNWGKNCSFSCHFMLGSFHLRQTAFGFCVGFNKRNKSIQLSPGLRARHLPIHYAQLTSALLYTREVEWKELTWDPKIVLGREILDTYPQYILDSFDSTEAATISARVHRPLGWRSITSIENVCNNRLRVTADIEGDTHYCLGAGWEILEDE